MGYGHTGLNTALATMALAALGAMVGYGCAGVAHAYAALLRQGARADAGTLMAALVRAAIRQPPSGMTGGGIGAISLGGMAAALYLRHVDPAYVAGAATACAVLLLLALIDMRTRLLPDALTLPLLWTGLAWAWAGPGPGLQSAVVAAVAGYGGLWILFWSIKAWTGLEGMGHGDFKLLAALGAWLGWPPLVWVLLFACLSGLSFAMWRQRSWRPSGAYPFGPFLAAGGALGLLAGTDVHFYF
ncbi:MAG TPA: A24 family peptidase [Candidimonas sp.]|nr:A24 family peptidase [Candidimonas sp.]